MCTSDRHRQFVKELLPKFQEITPVEIEEVVTRGRHPYWQAEYGACAGAARAQCQAPSGMHTVTGNQRTVGLRKADPAEVLRQGMLLRTAVGTVDSKHALGRQTFCHHRQAHQQAHNAAEADPARVHSGHVATSVLPDRSPTGLATILVVIVLIALQQNTCTICRPNCVTCMHQQLS